MHFSSFSHRRFYLSCGLILSGLLLSGYAVWMTGVKIHPYEQTLWMIDNSLSMAVEDVKVSERIMSRLENVRSLVMSGVENIRGEQGVILYARSAGILTPLTTDHDTLMRNIGNIMPVTDNGGSDISSAFVLISSLYSVRTSPLHIILLTDGGDTGGPSLPPLPPNTSLSIVGIGTDVGGPIFLGYDAIGHRRNKIYEGKEVIVPYESKNIDRIASFYHAPVFRVEKGDDLSRVFSLLSVNRSELPQTESSSLLVYFGSFFVLLGLFLHPYVRTHIR